MKIIFMGTPDFAVPVIDSIEKAGHEIILVVTQPDRPKGRKKELVPPPVKEWAIQHKKPVFQPERIKRPEAVEELKKYKADVAVVAAYGQILSEEILNMPEKGCINVHASLLPRYRGAAPIQWSILNGDEVTGVTTMQMGVGLDDGDILEQKEIKIEPEDTGGTLFDKLAIAGGELIVQTLEKAEKNLLKPVPQNEEESTHVGMIKKEYGNIDFEKSAKDIVNHIRGLNPWPSAYTFLNGNMMKFWRAEAVECPDTEAETAKGVGPDTETAKGRGAEAEAFDLKNFKAGQVVDVTRDRLWIKTGSGILSVKELQAAGKKRMDISEFLKGHAIKVGDIFRQE